MPPTGAITPRLAPPTPAPIAGEPAPRLKSFAAVFANIGSLLMFPSPVTPPSTSLYVSASKELLYTAVCVLLPQRILFVPVTVAGPGLFRNTSPVEQREIVLCETTQLLEE